MSLPLQITFRNMTTSDAVAARVKALAGGLEKLYGRITSVRVVIEAPHRHHRKGGLFQVHIDLVLPGGEISVRTDQDAAHEHEDVYVALRDAFVAAKRRVEDFARRRREGGGGRHAVPSER